MSVNTIHRCPLRLPILVLWRRFLIPTCNRSSFSILPQGSTSQHHEYDPQQASLALLCI